MKDYEKTIAQTLTDAQTTLEGLSNAEVQRRAAQYGRNRLKEGRKTPLIKRFLQQLADPMIIILLAAALISGVTSVLQGESMADVFIILIVVIINAVLNVLQESKAEKAVASLQEMSAATSKVLRDGRQQTVASEALVPGDVILLEAGDAVPADARVIEAASLKVEEAALTGESVPVTKQTEPLKEENGRAVPLGDRSNMVYMGSTVAYGRGKAVITQTGMQTEMGKIADALDKAEKSQTPLQIKLSQLSKTLTYLVVGICAVVFAVGVLRHEPVLDSFMVAVSLAVAAIPEGLAAVVTIVLSIGVIRMSKRSAIIRKLTAVETLGCAQIICSDKTGTLTQNRMTLVCAYADGEKTPEGIAAGRSDLGGKFAGEHIAHGAQTFMRVKLVHTRNADDHSLHHTEDGIVGIIVKLLYIGVGGHGTIIQTLLHGDGKRAVAGFKSLRRTVDKVMILAGVVKRKLRVE